MSGNMLILVGEEAYNRYAHRLTHNPVVLYPMEFVLGLVFLVHIGSALRLAAENWHARGLAPQPAADLKAASFASRSMALTGLLMLLFLINHLLTFRFGPHYETQYGGIPMRDLYRLVVEKFSDVKYTGFYLFCMGVLGVHLCHGTSGMFQSLGISGAREKSLRFFAVAVAIVIAAGFSIQPLVIFLKGM
jgi:succinate dehydrogenase / fumarate reductase cytochrome b subunit